MDEIEAEIESLPDKVALKKKVLNKKNLFNKFACTRLPKNLAFSQLN